MSKCRSNKKGGGVSLYINEKIPFIERHDLNVFNEYIESVFIEIDKPKLNVEKNVIIGVIYRPPNTDIEIFNEYLGSILDKVGHEKKLSYTLGKKGCYTPIEDNKTNVDRTFVFPLGWNWHDMDTWLFPNEIRHYLGQTFNARSSGIIELRNHSIGGRSPKSIFTLWQLWINICLYFSKVFLIVRTMPRPTPMVIRHEVFALAREGIKQGAIAARVGLTRATVKIANVIPLYKKEDPMIFSNYRPVSLLCSLCKVLEKIMYNRVISFLNENDVLFKYQFGFRKSHSTYLALC